MALTVSLADANTTSEWILFPETGRRLRLPKLDASNEEDVKAQSPASGGTVIESWSHTRQLV